MKTFKRHRQMKVAVVPGIFRSYINNDGIHEC